MSIISLNSANIYQNGESILHIADLKIEENEMVYLIGKTGSGKSSLLKVLYFSRLIPLKIISSLTSFQKKLWVSLTID